MAVTQGDPCAMALAAHLQRRGAVYYYRRRLPALADRPGRSTNICLSMRTSCPKRARYLAAQLTARIEGIRQVDMTAMTRAQFQAILKEAAAEHIEKLDRVAAAERSRSNHDVEEASRIDRAMGHAFRILAAGGPSATITDGVRDRLLAEGMPTSSMTLIETFIAANHGRPVVLVARAEAALSKVGAEPRANNVERAREAILRGMSAACLATGRRHEGDWTEDDVLLAEAVRSEGEPVE